MKRYRGYREYPERGPAAALTLGNFDGVHLGHQEILRAVAERARAERLESVVYTFNPHPRAILRPEIPLELLSTEVDRRERISHFGIDVLVEEPFTREFAAMEANQFFEKILRERMRAQQIIVGHDFAFGRGRAGHLAELRAFCEASGVALQVVQPFSVGGQVISSSSIRAALARGEVEQAALGLGRPFSYRGIVQRGAQRGRTIGVPTANLDPGAQCRVAYGVYVAGVRMTGREEATALRGAEGAKIWPAVCNFGVRPTVQTAHAGPTLEAHLLESTPQQWDLYGEELEVQLLHRIRGEQRFPSVEALRQQIVKDAGAAREWWERCGVLKK